MRWAMRQPRPAYMGFGVALARELGSRGITVNSVAPGYIADTRFFPGGLDPQRVAAIVGETPLGRTGRVEDIAAAVAWLASPGGGVRHRNGGVGERWLAGRQLKWRRRVTPMGVLVRLPENAGE
ncbi:SDR family oxidoreductase [Pseudomonas aeruginosa]|nr:SDR family oxidoreductase [Pseudomonas aeruginosa]